MDSILGLRRWNYLSLSTQSTSKDPFEQGVLRRAHLRQRLTLQNKDIESSIKNSRLCVTFGSSQRFLTRALLPVCKKPSPAISHTPLVGACASQIHKLVSLTVHTGLKTSILYVCIQTKTRRRRENHMRKKPGRKSLFFAPCFSAGGRKNHFRLGSES
jgi:hypothetical protein